MAITTHLSLKPKPRFGQNEQGFYASVTFIVKGVEWPDTHTLEHILVELPKYGDVIEDCLSAEWVPLAFRGLIVKEIAPTQPDLSKHNIWTAEVTFGARGGIIEPDKQYVRWSGGTITRRIETDLDGYAIGSRSWVLPDSGLPVSSKQRQLNNASLTNEHAEMGVDVQMPAMEFEIQVPLASSQWTQAHLYTTTRARSRVNETDFEFTDEWDTLFTIEAGWCLLRDVSVEPEPRSPSGHRIIYRFMVAALDLPDKKIVPHFWNRGPDANYAGPGDSDVPDPLPVAYGAFTAFKTVDEYGEDAPDKGEVPKPHDVRVFRAHQAYEFNNLPGIIR